MLLVVKNTCTSTKLAIKHVLLIDVVSFSEKCLCLKHNACVLGVHHHNMSSTMECRKLIDFNAIFGGLCQ
jgi:hypothetical protein